MTHRSFSTSLQLIERTVQQEQEYRDGTDCFDNEQYAIPNSFKSAVCGSKKHNEKNVKLKLCCNKAGFLSITSITVYGASNYESYGYF